MSTNVCKKIRKILVLIDNIFRDFFFLNFLNPPLVVSACVHLKRGRLLRNNFGDDLNLYLLSAYWSRSCLCSRLPLNVFRPSVRSVPV